MHDLNCQSHLDSPQPQTRSANLAFAADTVQIGWVVTNQLCLCYILREIKLQTPTLQTTVNEGTHTSEIKLAIEKPSDRHLQKPPHH